MEEQDEAKTMAEFKKRENRQMLLMVIGLIAAVPLTIFVKSGTILRASIVMGLIVAYVIFSFWNYSCPACGVTVWNRPKFCHKCGIRLRKDHHKKISR